MPFMLYSSALAPLAVLLKPVVLLARAREPLAVLKLPVVLLWSARSPLAVFWMPVVLLKSVLKPIAVFALPLVRLKSAPSPSAVFSWRKPPSAARAIGKSAKQASANVRRKPSRKDDRPINFPECRVVIFFVFIFC